MMKLDMSKFNAKVRSKAMGMSKMDDFKDVFGGIEKKTIIAKAPKFKQLAIPKPGSIEKTAWKRLKQQKGMRPLEDADKDKVFNIFDCEPYNRKRDGILDKMKNLVTGQGWTDSSQEPKVETYNVEQPTTVSYGEEKPVDIEYQPVIATGGKSRMVPHISQPKPLAEEVVSDIEATGKFFAPTVKTVAKGAEWVGKNLLYKPTAAVVGTAAKGVSALVQKGIEKEQERAMVEKKTKYGTAELRGPPVEIKTVTKDPKTGKEKITITTKPGDIIVPKVSGTLEIEALRKQNYITGPEAEARGLIRPGTGKDVPFVKVTPEEASKAQYGKYLEYGDPGKSQYYKQQYENLLKGYRIARKLPGKPAAYEWSLRTGEGGTPQPAMGMGNSGMNKVAFLLGTSGGAGGGFSNMVYGNRMSGIGMQFKSDMLARTPMLSKADMLSSRFTPVTPSMERFGSEAEVPKEPYVERSVSSRSAEPSSVSPPTASPGQGMTYSVRSRKWVRYPRGAYRKTKYLYPAQQQ